MLYYGPWSTARFLERSYQKVDWCELKACEAHASKLEKEARNPVHLRLPVRPPPERAEKFLGRFSHNHYLPFLKHVLYV